MISTTLCMFIMSPVFAKDKSVVLKIEPDTIVNTFKTLMKSEYLKKVADDFALRAADQFIKQIKGEQNRSQGRSGISISFIDTPSEKEIVQNPALLDPTSINLNDKTTDKDDHNSKQSDDVSEDNAEDSLLALMKSPPPDGDNLEKESLLTDVEKKVIEPEAHVYKINGKHFRKYDLFWR